MNLDANFKQPSVVNTHESFFDQEDNVEVDDDAESSDAESQDYEVESHMQTISSVATFGAKVVT